MLQFLFDTDHLTLLEFDDSRVINHLAQMAAGTVGFPAVVVEESLRGRLAAVATAKDGADRIARYALLLDSLDLFGQYPIAPYDQAAEKEFQSIRAMRLRFGSRDQKIAAIALAHHVTLVTRNKKDFGQIPGLVLEDWSV
jgi:tRNA(fMet)-specific endonuclease VapC